MTWNEHDATILEQQTTIMRYQTILKELTEENDDLQTEIENLEDELYDIRSNRPKNQTITLLILLQTATLLSILLL